MRSFNPILRKACLLAGFCLVLGTQTAQADDKSKKEPSRTLKLVSLEFPPMVYANEEGKPEGVSVAMVKAIFWELGYRTEIEIHRWQESLDMVRTGKADGIFTIYYRPDRKSYINFSKEILVQQPVAFFTKKGSKVKFEGDFANLKGMRVGTLGTITYGLRFDQAVEKYDFKTVKSGTLEESFNKLIKGDIDVVISSLFPAQSTLSRLGMSKKVQLLNYPVEITPSYFGFTKAKDMGDLPKQFDEALAEFRKQERHTKLLKRFDLKLPDEFLKNYRTGLSGKPAE